MNLLAIETSTSRASLALSVQGELFTAEENTTHQHGQVILEKVRQLMVDAAIDFKALDGIVFGEGPGSFTGVRMACSLAKGFAYAYNLPLFPVSGLHAIAFAVRHLNTPVLALLDARMQQVYWAFEPGKGGPAHVSSPENISIDLVTDKKKMLGQFVVAGVGFEPYVSRMPKALQESIDSTHDVWPKAEDMIALVKAGKIRSVSQALALPMYVRNKVVGGVKHG